MVYDPSGTTTPLAFLPSQTTLVGPVPFETEKRRTRVSALLRTRTVKLPTSEFVAVSAIVSLDPSPFGANQPTISGSGVRAVSFDGVRSTARDVLPVVGPFAQPSVAETLTAYDPSGTTAPDESLPSQTALKVLP